MARKSDFDVASGVMLGFAASNVYQGIRKGFDTDTVFHVGLFIFLAAAIYFWGRRRGVPDGTNRPKV